jgi:hypothetical protein
MKKKLKESVFYLDIMEKKKYNGYTTGETWNGWACPYFKFEEAEKIAEDQDLLNQISSGDARHEAKYVEDEDQFSFYEPYNDEWYDFKAVEINGEKLYPIGTRYWTWSEVE